MKMGCVESYYKPVSTKLDVLGLQNPQRVVLMDNFACKTKKRHSETRSELPAQNPSVASFLKNDHNIRCGHLFLWRRRESNSRPEKAPESFLHA